MFSSVSSSLVIVATTISMSFALGCTKSSPRSVGPEDGGTNTPSGPNGSTKSNAYTVTIVLPQKTLGLSLAGESTPVVAYTSFNNDGHETSIGKTQVTVDDDGISTAQLSVDPQYIYALEAQDFGSVIPQMGAAPDGNVQIPMTSAGKNVVDAIKAIPPESRPFLDPVAAEVLLPAGTKYDNSTMKFMIVALAEQAKTIPLEKRLEFNQERAKVTIDYKDIVKNSGDMEVIVASATAAAGTAFIAANPNLASNPIMQLLQRPAEALSAETSLIKTLPPAIQSQVLSQALTRQVVSAIVANNEGKAFSTADFVKVRPTLESVQSGYVAAKSRSDAFAGQFIDAVKSTSFANGKAKAFDPSEFIDHVGDVLDEVGSIDDLHAFLGNQERMDSNTPGCIEWREKCAGEAPPDPLKVAKDIQNAAHDLIGLLTELSEKDKGILACSSGLTQQTIETLNACGNGNCLDAEGFLNQGAKAACAINGCVKNFVKHNPYVEAMSLTCDIGDKLGEAIECNGFPGLGGGLAELCDTEIKNKKPVQTKPCPYTPSVPACKGDGSPLSGEDIAAACINQVQGYSSDADFSLFHGNCLAKCESLTAAAATSCEPAPPPPDSFCAVGSEVWGGFTYSNLTVSQCRSIGLDMCSGDDNSPCRCGHPLSASSCTEYYQQTQINSFPGELLPVAQDLCPDALLDAAKQITNSTDCESFYGSNPSFRIRWIQK